MSFLEGKVITNDKTYLIFHMKVQLVECFWLWQWEKWFSKPPKFNHCWRRIQGVFSVAIIHHQRLLSHHEACSCRLKTLLLAIVHHESQWLSLSQILTTLRSLTGLVPLRLTEAGVTGLQNPSWPWVLYLYRRWHHRPSYLGLVKHNYNSF